MKELWTVLLLLAAAGVAEAVEKPEPPETDPRPTYRADDELVALLAEAARDPDPRTREQAIRDLGEASNPAGLGVIVDAALNDESELVRCAAVRAAAQYESERARSAVAAAFRDEAEAVVLAGLEAASATADRDDLAGLLGHDSAHIRAAALAALTARDQPVPPVKLAELLADDTEWVRLQAARNAAKLPAGAATEALVAALARLTDAERPAVRSAALPAWAKHARTGVAARLRASLRNDSPWVRSGAATALLAAVEAGSVGGDEAESLLTAILVDDDETPMVHLAAVRTAEAMSCRSEACIRALFHRAMAAPYDDWDDRDDDRRDPPPEDLHYTARHALARAAEDEGSEAVLGLALAALPGKVEVIEATGDAAEDGDAEAVRRRRRATRDARACCALIAAVARHGGPEDASRYDYDALKSLVSSGWLLDDSRLRIELSDALSWIAIRTGDRSCVPLLLGQLSRHREAGLKYLVPSMQRPPPYHPPVGVATIEALARLRANEGLDEIIATAMAGYGVGLQGRLNSEAAAACRALPTLATDATRGKVAVTLARILEDRLYSSELVHFAAAIAAGEMMLEDDRILAALRAPFEEGKARGTGAVPFLKASRWALERITGSVPEMPPIRYASGDWLIRKLKER